MVAAGHGEVRISEECYLVKKRFTAFHFKKSCNKNFRVITETLYTSCEAFILPGGTFALFFVLIFT